ncbi:uncharacterized protein LOC131858412 [Cryptomeria japonica]|uniref:uncharacterized protein LOC131858412 n=1 Tax=Cryptomeria japonica TaxID=3369 RepID=UPI0027DA6B84|nr:uncharacterized protein LOC131858412 [Cryptomeria japonica]
MAEIQEQAMVRLNANTNVRMEEHADFVADEVFIGPVASRLAFPPSLSRIHDVFHVLVMRLYHTDIMHVLDWNALQVKDGHLSMEPVRILQHKEMSLRGQSIEQVRVQWDLIDDSSATWDDAVWMRELYPYLFSGFQE